MSEVRIENRGINMLTSRWKTALIDVSVDVHLSAEVDLGGNYEFLTVIQPELPENHATTVHISTTSGGTFYPIYSLKGIDVDDHAQTTSSLDTARMIVFNISGAQYIKMYVAITNLTADATFYVRGTDREA